MRARVLSTGGSRGALQAGALPVVLNAGLRVDLLVGASVGALNDVFLAPDPSAERARRLASLWRRLRPADIAPGRRSRVSPTWSGDTTTCTRPGRCGGWSPAHVPFRRLEVEDAAVPTILVATDLTIGAERCYGTAPVVDLAAASAAIPGMFPAFAYGGATDGAAAARYLDTSPAHPSEQRARQSTRATDNG